MNRCTDCEFYKPSRKIAGGRCPHDGGKSHFPDMPCDVTTETVDGTVVRAFHPLPPPPPEEDHMAEEVFP